MFWNIITILNGIAALWLILSWPRADRENRLHYVHAILLVLNLLWLAEGIITWE